MDKWLDPFSDREAPRFQMVAPTPPLPAVPEQTPEQKAAAQAKMRAMVMQALGPYAPKPRAATPDPEAPLMALIAAHALAVVEAAASARQKLASRQAAWRTGRALDGQPVA